VLLFLGERKLGSVNKRVKAQINKTSNLQQLHVWIGRVNEVSTWKELFEAQPTNP
jgi:hypothetical protein